MVFKAIFGLQKLVFSCSDKFKQSKLILISQRQTNLKTLRRYLIIDQTFIRDTYNIILSCGKIHTLQFRESQNRSKNITMITVAEKA